MNRKEVLKLLEMLYAVYPNTRIASPYLTAKAWEEACKNHNAKEIYLCAKFHVEENKFFPTPAELFKLLPRIRIIYSSELEGNNNKEECESDREVNEYLVNFMRLEGEIDENDTDFDLDDAFYSEENE